MCADYCGVERLYHRLDFVFQAGISALRRLRKSDNNRIARACGATIVNRPDELKEEDVGTGAGLFEIRKVNCHAYFVALARAIGVV